MKLDLTQEEMARKLNINRGAYASYEQEVAKPPPPVLDQLVHLGFTVSEQMHPYDQSGKTSGTPGIGTPFRIGTIPQVGLIMGSKLPASSWVNPFTGPNLTTKLVDACYGGENRFITEATDDANMPLILPGDLCVWQEASIPKVGLMTLLVKGEEAIAARMDHNGIESTYKQLNPRFTEPLTKGEWQVFAHLVGIIREEGSRVTKIYDENGIRI